MPFKPQLPRHRAAFDRVARYRIPLVIVFMVIGVSMMLLAPVEFIERFYAPFFVLFAALLVMLETRLFFILWQDLRDRPPRRR